MSYECTDDRSTYPEIRSGQVWAAKRGGDYSVVRVGSKHVDGSFYVVCSRPTDKDAKYAINDWHFLNQVTELKYDPPNQLTMF